MDALGWLVGRVNLTLRKLAVSGVLVARLPFILSSFALSRMERLNKVEGNPQRLQSVSKFSWITAVSPSQQPELERDALQPSCWGLANL